MRLALASWRPNTSTLSAQGTRYFGSRSYPGKHRPSAASLDRWKVSRCRPLITPPSLVKKGTCRYFRFTNCASKFKGHHQSIAAYHLIRISDYTLFFFFFFFENASKASQAPLCWTCIFTALACRLFVMPDMRRAHQSQCVYPSNLHRAFSVQVCKAIHPSRSRRSCTAWQPKKICSLGEF